MPAMDKRFNIRIGGEDARPYEELAARLGVPTPAVMRQALVEFAPAYRQLVAMAAQAERGEAVGALDVFEGLVKHYMSEGERILVEAQDVRQEIEGKKDERKIS